MNAPSFSTSSRGMPVSMDEWIIGQSEDGNRRHVVHTIAPRFIAAFSEQADECSNPIEVDEIDPIPDAHRWPILKCAAEILAAMRFR
jgi:hypothetical protein